MSGHDRQPYDPPRKATVGEKISFELIGILGTPHAVDHDVREVSDDDDPVQPMHVSRLTAVSSLQDPQQDERDHLHGKDADERAFEGGFLAFGHSSPKANKFMNSL